MMAEQFERYNRQNYFALIIFNTRENCSIGHYICKSKNNTKLQTGKQKKHLIKEL